MEALVVLVSVAAIAFLVWVFKKVVEENDKKIEEMDKLPTPVAPEKDDRVIAASVAPEKTEQKKTAKKTKKSSR